MNRLADLAAGICLLFVELMAIGAFACFLLVLAGIFTGTLTP